MRRLDRCDPVAAQRLKRGCVARLTAGALAAILKAAGFHVCRVLLAAAYLPPASGAADTRISVSASKFVYWLS